MNITTVKRSFPLHFSRYASTDLTSVRIDQRLLSALIRAPARVRSCEVQALCSSGTTKQPSLPCKVSPFFSDLCLNILLLVDSLSTRRQGHCITWEIRLHTVHHPLSSSLFQPYSFTSRTPAFMGSHAHSASLYHLRDCHFSIFVLFL